MGETRRVWESSRLWLAAILAAALAGGSWWSVANAPEVVIFGFD